MNDKPKAKRPRKRWKRVLKWTLGTIFVVLLILGVCRLLDDRLTTATQRCRSSQPDESRCVLRLWNWQS